ncbi:MAG TPA: hypothetical protein VMF89_24310 [Polyangiales bacterium]|nr:hypothetical protein [Polyangiales bacterium]
MSISLRAVGVFSVMAGLLSCAAAQSPEPKTSAEPATTELSALEEPSRAQRADSTAAEANTCEDRPCYSDGDCCKSYSCGYDPERSHVQRYCLGQ